MATKFSVVTKILVSVLNGISTFVGYSPPYRTVDALFLLYSHGTTIQIYRCREIRNTNDSPLFRYETFINFLGLVFRYEERETQLFYADCTI